MKTVVLIGGGSGTFTLLKGLRQFPTNNIVIVTTADDGASTGALRRDLGVMPMGDVRQCLIGLSYTDPALQKLFGYRFDAGEVKGYSMGTLILAALQKITGSPEGAIAEAARILNVRGEVLFVSKEPTTLSAQLKDGGTIKGEHNIDEPVSTKRSPIKKLLLSRCEINPRVANAISRADAIVFGPGDLYTSTLPNLLVPGVSEAIRLSKARKILITNIMTKIGQTDGFNTSDFLRETNAYLGGSDNKSIIDTVIVNMREPEKTALALYKKEKAVFVKPEIEKLKKANVKVIAEAILSDEIHSKAKGDPLKRSIIRHDSEKTAEIIWNLIK